MAVEDLSIRVERVVAPVREQLLTQLRQAIVAMQLKPGQRLVERELIARTGVSRTTVREVLRQLAAEGLVTTLPHKGTVVASPDRERAVELYEIRGVLEGMAARQFAERATDADRRALRAAFGQFEVAARNPAGVSAILAAKARFYEVLFEGTGNVTIKQVVQGLQARVTALRAASLGRPGRAARSVAEVRAIVVALEAGDGDRAAAACVEHIQHAAESIMDSQVGPDRGSPR